MVSTANPPVMASLPKNCDGTSDDNVQSPQSAAAINPVSREGSRPPKKKHNVRFTAGGESLNTANQRAAFDVRDDTNAPPKPKPLPKSRWSSGSLNGNSAISFQRSSKEKSEDIADEPARAPLLKARPSIMRLPSSESDEGGGSSRSNMQGGLGQADNDEDKDHGDAQDEDDSAKAFSQKSANERAQRLSRMIDSHSAPGSRFASPHQPVRTVVRSPPPSPPLNEHKGICINLNDIPLEKLKSKRTKYGIEDESDEEIDEDEKKPAKNYRINGFHRVATRLFRHYSKNGRRESFKAGTESPESHSGAQTPIYERDPSNYVPKPSQYREGYLSSLLKLHNQQGLGAAISHLPLGPGTAARVAKRSSSGAPLLRSTSLDGAIDTPGQSPSATPGGSPTSSGASTPKHKHQKWYYKTSANSSTGALSDLVSSSTVFAQPVSAEQSSVVRPKPKHRPFSHQAIDTILGKKKVKPDDSIRIHLADIMERHGFLLKMCRALMSYGAPTHRLEGTHEISLVRSSS